jgi:hypothetical protein
MDGCADIVINRRMKDFYDLDSLLSRFTLNNEIPQTAIQNTLARRNGTDLMER